MARLLFILTLLLTISCGQTTTKLSSNKKQIDLASVSSIEILKVTGPSDTIKTFWKRLTEEQVKFFVDKWNISKDEELRKYLPTFKISVYFKNDSTREFRANGQFIKEDNDCCFDFKDNTYFEKLYSAATLKGNHQQ